MDMPVVGRGDKDKKTALQQQPGRLHLSLPVPTTKHAHPPATPPQCKGATCPPAPPAAPIEAVSAPGAKKCVE